MSIFSRLSDIVNSNLNALLDKAEDPEKMVRLIIQEMEETLVEVRTSSARTIAEKKELLRRQDQLATEAGEWERKAEVALRKGREDLAKGALLEKSKVADLQLAVESELQVVEDQLLRLGTDIEALQQKLQDARNRQRSMVLRGKNAQARLGARRQLHSNQVDDAMQRFERYERRIDNLESQVEVYDLGKASVADEIRALEDDEAVDAELARLKARLAADEGGSRQE
jgi:phage shock protein A